MTCNCFTDQIVNRDFAQTNADLLVLRRHNAIDVRFRVTMSLGELTCLLIFHVCHGVDFR